MDDQNRAYGRPYGPPRPPGAPDASQRNEAATHSGQSNNPKPSSRNTWPPWHHPSRGFQMGLDSQEQQIMMKWGRLLYVLYIVLWICFLVVYIWALANVLYYGLGVILPVLETTARVFRSFQSLFGLVSFLLWYLVRWTGYVVGFMVVVALGIWSDVNGMA